MASYVHPAFQLRCQTVALSHGNLSFHGNDVCVVDDPVHNSIANGAVLGGIGIDSFVPTVRIILRTENGGAVLGSRLNDFKQVVGLLQRQRADCHRNGPAGP